MNERIYSFTVNTDASHHPTENIAGWACWIKSSHYKVQDSGLFSQQVPNSSVAELLAVEQALILLDKLISSQEFLLTQNRILLYINTDSTFVIQALNGNIKRSKYLEIARRIRALTENYDIDVRHVKAHTNKKDARSYVNAWCDKAAKSHVREKIKELHVRTEKV